MSKFELANKYEYLCNSCSNSSYCYFVFVPYAIQPQRIQSMNDFLERMKEKPENLHFLCKDCYNNKLFEQKPILEKVNELNIQINNSTQQIADQLKQIHELNSRIEQLLKPEISMFSFDEIKIKYKDLESQIGKLQDLIGNETIQTEIQKSQEMFKTQNTNGLQKISKEFECLLQSNINETKENVQKIQHMRSLIYYNSGDLIYKNVVSKVKMEQFIEEEIQNQNLNKKIDLKQDLQKFMVKLGIDPQSEQAENETQQ